MNLEPTIQKEKSQYRILIHICGIWKEGTDGPILRADIKDKLAVTVREAEGEGGASRAGSVGTCTEHHRVGTGWPVGMCCVTHGAQAHWQPGGVAGREAQEGGAPCLWLILVDVWQKPAQHCRVITTQLTNLNIYLSKESWCVWIRGTSELVDSVKQMILPVVGGRHPIS